MISLIMNSPFTNNTTYKFYTVFTNMSSIRANIYLF